MKASPVDFKVRRALGKDIPVWLPLRRLLWRKTPRPAHLREMRLWLSTNGCVCFLAHDPKGRLAGFLEGRVRPHIEEDWREKVAYLDGWCVVPSLRRQGVARAMLGAFHRWAKARGCRRMLSDTWARRPSAIAVHRALGFKVVDRRVHFEKPLAG
jgi:GNAT superfamily N-acetyltransferase